MSEDVKVERVEGEQDELPIKRLYLPFVIKAKCPTCGRTAERDLSSSYMSYPVPGKPETVMLSCYDEDGEETCYTDVDVTIDFTVTASNARKSDW